MLVKTLRRHGYARQIRMPGEEYEIQKEKDVKVLEAVGRVRRVPKVVTDSLKVEVEKPQKKKKKATKKKATKKKTAKKTGGTYKRKDMVVE